jgi:hypothetical protein
MLLDDKKFVKTGADLLPEDLDRAAGRCRAGPTLETSIPGVFCVGDARSTSVKRVASAVGEGAICVQMVHRALAECERAVPVVLLVGELEPLRRAIAASLRRSFVEARIRDFSKEFARARREGGSR